mgnify:CR=1 FL=1
MSSSRTEMFAPRCNTSQVEVIAPPGVSSPDIEQPGEEPSGEVGIFDGCTRGGVFVFTAASVVVLIITLGGVIGA